MQKIIKNINGFSLLEVLVAVMIIGTTFLGLFQAFPYAFAAIRGAENKTKAAYIAQSKIEQLYYLGYNNIATGTIEVKQPLAASGDLSLFQRQTVVTAIDGDLMDSVTDLGMKQIDVTVYYTNEFTKSEKSLEVSTILSDH